MLCNRKTGFKICAWNSLYASYLQVLVWFRVPNLLNCCRKIWKLSNYLFLGTLS